MGDKLVVEPASVPDHPGSTSVARGEASDRLIFPNVDSCLAILFIMADDAVIGAHVGQYGGQGFSVHDPDGYATAMVKDMKMLTDGKKILQVFTLGDGYFNRRNILADVKIDPVIVYSRVSVDITVDPKLRVITVVANKKKDDKKAEWRFAELRPGTINI